MSETTTSQGIEARVRALAEPLLTAEGLELVEVEWVREQGAWLLRLYIDLPGGQVGVDECARASRVLDPALDVEDFIPHEYSLEVSTPGLERPLRTLAHFQKVKGQKVRVKTYGPLFDPPRKHFQGALVEAAGDAVTVEVEGAGPFTIPLKEIAKANLLFEFESGPKPKPGQKKSKS